jgi:2-polyprenyl-3-methyl-5-hydroxy-6-metoxy-1,4-benzoquinol methylase
VDTLKQDSFRETDIRPDALMAGQADRFAADVRRLVRHKPDFVVVGCPACGGSASRAEFEKMGIDYRSCTNCETMFVSPRPRPEHLREYYVTSENYKYWNAHIFPASEAVRREKIFRPRVKRLLEMCRRHGIEAGTLLEVGAGFGTFCQELATEGVFSNIVAVEPTPDLAATCRQRGLTVLEKPIEEVDARDLPAADVVASFECIEHLFNPGDFLRGCGRLLRPGGLLFLTCPNGKGFDVVALGAASDTVDAEHLNYFNPRSLPMLVQSCGLEVLEVTTPGVLDAEIVRKRTLNGALDLKSQPFLKQVLIDEWERLGGAFQEFLVGNCLSTHMWLVARRPHA